MIRRCVCLVLVSACAIATLAVPSRASNCAGVSTGLISLTDLGAGFYKGAQGGLYPGASNHRPPAHNAAGIAIANSLVPLDTLGNPDLVGGKLVLISIGMSNGTMEFSQFVPKATSDPLKNPQVVAIDCAEGGQAANIIKNPNAAYWDTVLTRLRGHGSSPMQPQAVWIKEANISPTGGFPASADTLTWYLGSVVRNIKAKLPNVKLAYFTSRIYAGYASSTLNPEPYAYESGFAIKRLITAQISGVDSLNYSPDSGAVYSPWLAWGPYLWADGLLGRADSLKWTCDEYVASDGTHPAPVARLIVADSLLAFFRADESTAPWYLAHSVGVGPPPASDLAFALAPNPAGGPVEIAFTPKLREHWRLEIVDIAGRRIAEIARGLGRGARETRWWTPASEIRAGIYWAVLVSERGRSARRMVVLGAR